MPVETLQPPSRTASISAARPSIGVLDVWSHIEPRFGGVGPAASALSTAVGRYGMRIAQVAICHESEKTLADGIDSRVSKIRSSAPRGIADLRIANALRQAVGAADVCHVHGMWVPHCLAARRLARELGKPVVSSVHGGLEQWELRHKWLKKALYSWLLERPSLERSGCLRALSEREVGDYRRYGSRAAIALVPNGIEPLERVNPSRFLEWFPELKHKQIVLFLGRIHEKKGILNLVRAWKTVAARRHDAHLVIAGPSYEDAGDKVRELISDLQLRQAVTLAGVISGPIKTEALSASKYFCLPSYSEGLSVAVLEALSIGLPPVITPECNFQRVEACGAGRITSNEPDTLADTLVSCLDQGSRPWQDMSRASQRLARTDFDWNAIGATMGSVYEWLLGGDRPDCVVVK
jgi:glycosyltransferase involved in cell wall biosynthesis